MTPKKIYIRYIKGFKVPFISSSGQYQTEEPLAEINGYEAYILESEHNRLVEELKAEIEKLKADLDYVCGVKGIF